MNFSAITALLSFALACNASASVLSSNSSSSNGSDSCLYASSSSDLSYNSRVCTRDLEAVEAQPAPPASNFYEKLARSINKQSPLWFDLNTRASIADKLCTDYDLTINVISPFGTGVIYPGSASYTVPASAGNFRSMELNKGVYTIRRENIVFSFVIRSNDGQFLLIELVGFKYQAPLAMVNFKPYKFF